MYESRGTKRSAAESGQSPSDQCEQSDHIEKKAAIVDNEPFAQLSGSATSTVAVAIPRPATIDRSNRMFGTFLSHIGKAKVDSNKGKELADKQKARLESITHRNAFNRIESIFNKQISEVRHQFDTWRDKFEPTASMIITHTRPQIPWVPGKHSEETRRMVERNGEDFREELAYRRGKMGRMIAALEKERDQQLR